MPSTRRRKKCRPIFLLSWLLFLLRSWACLRPRAVWATCIYFAPSWEMPLPPQPLTGSVGRGWAVPLAPALQAHPRQHPFMAFTLRAWQGGLEEEWEWWAWNGIFVLDYSSHLWLKETPFLCNVHFSSVKQGWDLSGVEMRMGHSCM